MADYSLTDVTVEKSKTLAFGQSILFIVLFSWVWVRDIWAMIEHVDPIHGFDTYLLSSWAGRGKISSSSFVLQELWLSFDFSYKLPGFSKIIGLCLILSIEFWITWLVLSNYKKNQSVKTNFKLTTRATLNYTVWHKLNFRSPHYIFGFVGVIFYTLVESLSVVTWYACIANCRNTLSFLTIENIDLTRQFTLPEICASLETRILCKIEFNFHVDVPFLYPLNRGDGDEDRNGHLAFKWVKFT